MHTVRRQRCFRHAPRRCSGLTPVLRLTPVIRPVLRGPLASVTRVRRAACPGRTDSNHCHSDSSTKGRPIDSPSNPGGSVTATSSPADRPAGSRLVLATDLDGTFLGGSDAERRELYRWIERRRDRVTLVFVTGRDLPFIRNLVDAGSAPRPDYVIGDVGTTIAGGPGIQPIPALEAEIARRWGDAGPRLRTLLEGEPGLRMQPTQFRYRLSYYYDPASLSPATVDKVRAAGFDCLLSADTFFDVLPPGISKGPTLLRLIEHLRLPAADVLVAGDTLNDLSLFETGLAGVAVGNSEPALRERVARLAHVYLSPQHGAAGILDAIRRPDSRFLGVN